MRCVRLGDDSEILVEMVDTEAEEEDLDREYLLPRTCPSSATRLRPRSASFSANCSSAIPFLCMIVRQRFGKGGSRGCLLSHKFIRDIATKFRYKFRICQLLRSGWSRSIRPFLSRGFAFIAVVACWLVSLLFVIGGKVNISLLRHF